MNKVTLIKAKDEDELAKKMNTATFFASQPMQKEDGTWICFTYNREKDKQEPQEKEPNEDFEEEPATEAQLNYLDILKVKIPKNLTKKEASKLIEDKKNKTNKY